MKKKLILASLLMLGCSSVLVYAQNKGHFDEFLIKNINKKLTENSWDKLIGKLNGLFITVGNNTTKITNNTTNITNNTTKITNLEQRIIALENKKPTPPSADTTCRASNYDSYITDKETYAKFAFREDLANGNTRMVTSEKNGKIPNWDGSYPTFTAKLSCNSWTLTYTRENVSCPSGENYGNRFGTCGRGCTVSGYDVEYQENKKILKSETFQIKHWEQRNIIYTYDESGPKTGWKTHQCKDYNITVIKTWEQPSERFDEIRK